MTSFQPSINLHTVMSFRPKQHDTSTHSATIHPNKSVHQHSQTLSIGKRCTSPLLDLAQFPFYTYQPNRTIVFVSKRQKLTKKSTFVNLFEHFLRQRFSKTKAYLEQQCPEVYQYVAPCRTIFLFWVQYKKTLLSID